MGQENTSPKVGAPKLVITGKPRSPSYPSIAASKALDIARKVYGAEKRFDVPLAVVTKHGGYTGTKSGPSIRLVAALKKYRVFEDRKGDDLLHMTDAVKRHVMAQTDAGIRDALLAEMVDRYDEIKEAKEKYPDGLPGDEALKSYLVLERQFTDFGASEFIETLKENLSVAKPGASDQNGNMNTPQGSGETPPLPPKPHHAPPVRAGEFVLRWNVSSDRVVEFRAPADLTPDDWELVSDYVAVAKKAAARRAKQDDEPS
jgi:hypothetical protein